MPHPLPTACLGFLLASLPHFLDAQLAVSPRVVDFGSRGHNENPSQTITVKNDGAAPLVIRELRPTCSCISVDSTNIRAAIPPGGQIEVKVSMGSGRAMGSLEKHLDVIPADLKVPPMRIAIAMKVFEAFSQEPRDLHFEGAVGGGPVTQSFVIKKAGGAAFTLDAGEVKQAAGATSRAIPHLSARVADVPGGKRVDVTLAPTHPEGRVFGNLECKLDGKLLVVPVVGEVFRGIKVSPTYFNFNRVAADDPASYVEESILSSTDGRPFKILKIEGKLTRNPVPDAAIAFEDLPRDGVPGGAAKEHVIRARIAGGTHPPKNASFSGTVRVVTDHPEKAEVQLNFFGFFAEPKQQVGGTGGAAVVPPKK